MYRIQVTRVLCERTVTMHDKIGHTHWDMHITTCPAKRLINEMDVHLTLNKRTCSYSVRAVLAICNAPSLVLLPEQPR
jgi:hypothetical protein